MEFAFTDEQLMIKDTAESYLSEVSTSAAIRQAMETELGYDRQQWQSVCSDLYWQAIHTPDQFGGMALGYVELVAMQEQMGRFLFCSPFFSTVCLALNSLLLAATEEQKQHYIPLLLQGKTATLAFVGSNAACFGGQWDDEAIEIISAHHKTQHLIINKDLKGHGGEIGKKFEDELKKASKRYFSKRKN